MANTSSTARKAAAPAKDATSDVKPRDAAAQAATDAARVPDGSTLTNGAPGTPTARVQPGAANSADSGPGTPNPVTAEENDTMGVRMPQRMVTTTPETGPNPLEAPDAALQPLPPDGYAESTTNNVAAATGIRTVPGENHVRLYDEDGNDIDDIEGLFDDPGTTSTFLLVNKRVFEEYTPPQSKQKFSRLRYAKGARVDRFVAARLIEAQKVVKEAQNA